MNLNLMGVLHVRCLTMAEASREARRYGSPGKLEDEGEVIATVTDHGHLYDMDGLLIPIEHLRSVA